MEQTKNFVTIFPELLPVHLKKDVGMIPYSLRKYETYNSKIICYRNDELSYEMIENYNIECIEKNRNDSFDFSKYLYRDAKNIDILNLYHITSRRNIFWIVVYLLRNPKGKVYLKLDADFRMLNEFEMYPMKIKAGIKNFLLRKCVHLYTAESILMSDLISKKWRIDVKFLPDGFTGVSEICNSLDKRAFFLTVGRLGTEQKATDILLQAYAKIAHATEYDLILIGEIDKGFYSFIEDFFKENPGLRQRVIFLGNIDDIDSLNEYYKKASVFILPSRWESFGIAALEALSYGDYLILSDKIPPAKELTNNQEYGTTVDISDIDQLATAMLNASQCDLTTELINKMQIFAKRNFSWEVISEQLNEYLSVL